MKGKLRTSEENVSGGHEGEGRRVGRCSPSDLAYNFLFLCNQFLTQFRIVVVGNARE